MDSSFTPKMQASRSGFKVGALEDTNVFSANPAATGGMQIFFLFYFFRGASHCLRRDCSSGVPNASIVAMFFFIIIILVLICLIKQAENKTGVSILLKICITFIMNSAYCMNCSKEHK